MRKARNILLARTRLSSYMDKEKGGNWNQIARDGETNIGKATNLVADTVAYNFPSHYDSRAEHPKNEQKKGENWNSGERQSLKPWHHPQKYEKSKFDQGGRRELLIRHTRFERIRRPRLRCGLADAYRRPCWSDDDVAVLHATLNVGSAGDERQQSVARKQDGRTLWGHISGEFPTVEIQVCIGIGKWYLWIHRLWPADTGLLIVPANSMANLKEYRLRPMHVEKPPVHFVHLVQFFFTLCLAACSYLWDARRNPV